MRQATAAGLGGLAVAIVVGVMAFAFTTSSAERADTRGGPQFLSTSSKVTELRTFSAMRTLIQEATAAAFSSTAAAIDGSANELPLLASRPGDEADEALDDVDDDAASLDAELIIEDRSLRGASVIPTVEAQPLSPPPGRETSTPEPETPVVAAAVAPPAGTAPVLVVGDRVEATISFYYCARGELGLHPGDGGKFCGVMRDGSTVYSGAAACAYTYLGQRFRIEGDPLDRVYTCADTGSAVHGLHRDIWFMTSDEGWTWQQVVGQRAVIEIVE